MTRASVTPGRLDLGIDDHQNLCLIYDPSSIKKLTCGMVYWLQGAVVGCSRHEMPFLQCHQMASPPAIAPLITKDILEITGVGTLVTKIDEQGGHLHLFVQHHVGIHTVFGDEIITVKYVVNKSQCGEDFALSLKSSDCGKFIGTLAGWDRNNSTMVVDLSAATISRNKN
ncbi:hypothetical protein PGT21_016207 [Puccinia graminis f. sp. tritici]|uniref:Uncharacterized protein n=1 Tax=Puccinia graminis f. sp. tritici TaxID=56615 RepID=A0A5B0QTJ9_PUCGR|nr:hypothetical protein PGT21_016207 [Puccinia graminis f. sp. tritici]